MDVRIPTNSRMLFAIDEEPELHLEIVNLSPEEVIAACMTLYKKSLEDAGVPPMVATVAALESAEVMAEINSRAERIASIANALDFTDNEETEN